MTTPASTTAAGVPKRFEPKHLCDIETGIGKVNTGMLALLPLVRRNVLTKAATIDGDATDVEVYGRTKEKAAHSYTGQLNLRPTSGFGPQRRCHWPRS